MYVECDKSIIFKQFYIIACKCHETCHTKHKRHVKTIPPWQSFCEEKEDHLRDSPSTKTVKTANQLESFICLSIVEEPAGTTTFLDSNAASHPKPTSRHPYNVGNFALLFLHNYFSIICIAKYADSLRDVFILMMTWRHRSSKNDRYKYEICRFCVSKNIWISQIIYSIDRLLLIIANIVSRFSWPKHFTQQNISKRGRRVAVLVFNYS